MKVCFFTFLTESYKNNIEYDLFEKSLKHFHPEIPLILFKDEEIKEFKKIHPSLDLYKAKATAAKSLYDEYDLIINIDADHFIFGRFDEILENNFDVAAPSNYNLYENVDLSMESYKCNKYKIISEKKYIQAGLIASNNKNFWNAYENASIKHSDSLTCKDNDVLNLVVEFGGFDFKLLDGDFDLDSSDRKCFYGCSSLNLEKDIKLVNNVPCINNKPVKAYHVAKGGMKPKFNQIFNNEIIEWFNYIIK